MQELSHTDKKGNASMVDVGNKPDLVREAYAEGFIRLQKQTMKLIKENQMKKGDVLSVARIAGIQAAKQTPVLVPLCHTLLLSKVSVEFEMIENGIKVLGYAKCTGPTGVEMEALTSVNIALLTIYDMCKAVDKNMVITDIKLLSKTKKEYDV